MERDKGKIHAVIFTSTVFKEKYNSVKKKHRDGDRYFKVKDL